MIRALFIAATLLLAACGGSTSVSTDEPTDAAEEAATTVAAASTDAPSDDAADEPMEDDASSSEDDATTSVSSIDDIPQVCRDLMADFLKDIEPIVSPIDWNTATMADFESISGEFEARADQFDMDSDAAGECDDIELEDDETFDLLVEFAQDEAPGTAGFLTFLGDIANAVVDATTGAGDAAFETCDDAIAFVDGLIADYDSLEQVPASEITTMANIATVIFTCTPEQIQYFDSPEVSAFLEGFFG